MGSASRVRNAEDGREYLVSTMKNPMKIWETAVFEKGFLGLAGKLAIGVALITPDQMRRVGISFEDLILSDAGQQDVIPGKPTVFFPVEFVTDQDMLGAVHDIVQRMVESSPRAEWRSLINDRVSEYLNSNDRRIRNILFNPRRDLSSNNWTTLALELSAVLADLRNTWFRELHEHLFSAKPNAPQMIVVKLAGNTEKQIQLLQVGAVATRIAVERYLPNAFIPVFVTNEFGPDASENAKVRSWGDPPYPTESITKFIGALGGAFALYLYGPGFKADKGEAIFDFVLLNLFFRTQSMTATYFGHPETGIKVMKDFDAVTERLPWKDKTG